MKAQTREDIVLEVPKELPPVPRLAPKDLESLRPVRSAKLAIEVAEANRQSVVSHTGPQVDVVARASSTGVDQISARSRAQMFSGGQPDYYVGVEFLAPLDSSLVRGARADAQLAVDLARANAISAADLLRDQLRASEREVNARYEYARAAADGTRDRAQVVKEIESAYRQGRQPLVEVIRAYNDLFAARLDEAQATGDYNMALNRLAAARDELLVAPGAKR
jgi:outer membrane protein TolC